MSYDLHGGLHDLSGDPVTSGDLPLPTVLARLHHARRVRTASYSAVGMAAAAAIALAVVASGATRVPDPAPPAQTDASDDDEPFSGWSPTPIPTPAPTPTATPTATPGSDGSSPRCGQVLGWEHFSDDYPFNTSHVRVTPDATGAFELRGAIAADVGVELSVTQARLVDVHATVWGLDRWTVVGYADVLSQDVDPAEPRSGVPVGADVRLAACAGESLEEGTFYLIATYAVTLADGSEHTLVNQTYAYVGDEPTSWPDENRDTMRNGSRTDQVSLAHRSAAGLPGCGETYARGATPGAPATITAGPDSSLGRVALWGYVTNAGSAVVEGRFGSAILTVTHGGVVVAQTPEVAQPVWYLKDFVAGTTGQSASFGTTLAASACSDSERLPNGEYQLWVVLPLWRTPDIEAVPEFVYAGPYAFTISDSPLSDPSVPEPTPTATPAVELPPTVAPVAPDAEEPDATTP